MTSFVLHSHLGHLSPRYTCHALIVSYIPAFTHDVPGARMTSPSLQPSFLSFPFFPRPALAHQPCQLHIPSHYFISVQMLVLLLMFWILCLQLFGGNLLSKFSLLSALMIKTPFSVRPFPSASGLCHLPWFLLTLPQLSPLLHSQPSAQCSLCTPTPQLPFVDFSFLSEAISCLTFASATQPKSSG